MGSACPVGGGGFSGKDFSKIDRSGAYLARYIAKNIVSSGLVPKCVVEISYMIGVPEPSSINIETFGRFKNDLLLTDIVKKIFPMTPKQIVDHFDMRRPIYLDTARNGHFGRTGLPWERMDKVNDILSAIYLSES